MQEVSKSSSAAYRVNKELYDKNWDLIFNNYASQKRNKQESNKIEHQRTNENRETTKASNSDLFEKSKETII
jgi:hypothetical protein